MADYDDVCVLVPTLDEAETIGDVIDRFHAAGLANVFVVDGRSTDETQTIAAEHGARVAIQNGVGKGQAIREGLGMIDEPYVLMADGDGTYRPEDADAMLEPLLAGECEHVIGNRFADIEDGAMTRLNRVGNGIINRSFQAIHGQDLKDILSGYRAFTMDSVGQFDLTADGFGVETELAVECVKHGVPTEVVPIRYEARPGDSEPNLHPVRDGGVILLTLYRLAKTHNPLFYFGSVGALATAIGWLLAAYVGIEWVTQRVSHEVIAVVSGFFILMGLQLIIFGVLSDVIVSLHREQANRIDRLAESIDGRQTADGPDTGEPADEEHSTAEPSAVRANGGDEN